MIEFLCVIVAAILIGLGVFYVSKRSLSSDDSNSLTETVEKTEKDNQKKKQNKKSKTKNETQNNPKTNKVKKPKIKAVPEKPVEKLEQKVQSAKAETVKPESSISSDWQEVGKGSKKAIKSKVIEDESKQKTKAAEKELANHNKTMEPSKNKKGKVELNQKVQKVPEKKMNEESVVEKNENEVKTEKVPQKNENKLKVEKVPEKKENKSKLEKVKPIQNKPSEVIEQKIEKKQEIVTKKEPESAEQKKIIKFELEESKLRKENSELKEECENLKRQKKETSDTFVRSLTQLTIECEQLRTKLKVFETTEANLAEDIKKANATITDLRNQMKIVQTELAKKINKCDELNRDKEILENEKDKLEAANVQLNKKLTEQENRHTEKINQINANCQEIIKKHDMEINKLSLDSKDHISALLSSQQQCSEANQKLHKLQNELITSDLKCSDFMKEKSQLESRIAELQSNLTKTQQNDGLTSKIKEMEKQIEEKETEITNLNENLKQITNEKNKINESKEIELENSTKLLKDEIDDLNKKLQSVQQDSGLNNKLQEEIDQLKQKLESAEKESHSNKKLIDEIEQLKQKIALVDQEKDSVSVTLSKTIKEKSEEEKRLKDSVSELQLTVEKYKAGLERTENVLSQLQISVNEEEKKWRDNLLKSEMETEKCKSELVKVHSELLKIQSRTDKKELDFAYHCVDKSSDSLMDEIESRMENFRISLDKIMQERDDAVKQLEHHSNGSRQLNGAPVIAPNEDGDKPESNQQLEDLKQEKAQLEIQCNKYKALVDIGKDALAAESEKVQKLEAELNQINISQTNNVGGS